MVEYNALLTSFIVSNDVFQDDSVLDSDTFDLWGAKAVYFKVLSLLFCSINEL